jgi:hypothetical protein
VKLANFPDDWNETERKNNQIRLFGYSGHLKNTKETEFGDNCPKPLGSLAKKWNLF